MTNVKRVLALMADGQPRTKEQVMQALGLTAKQAGSALRTARRAMHMSVLLQAPTYAITPAGAAEGKKPAVDYRALERVRSERRRKERDERVAVKAANAKISAKMASDRQARKAERDQARIEKESITWRAKNGVIPNSVFAMGSVL